MLKVWFMVSYSPRRGETTSTTMVFYYNFLVGKRRGVNYISQPEMKIEFNSPFSLNNLNWKNMSMNPQNKKYNPFKHSTALFDLVQNYRKRLQYCKYLSRLTIQLVI